MSNAQIHIAGFANTDDGDVAWTDDSKLGIIRNDDGSLTLLDSDGMPSSFVLSDDDAAHIIGRARAYDDDAAATIRRWDYFASSTF